ncbi:MAG: type II secretion system F family protein [Armatimonadia bacterium]|nr:type II secretion system F family protein [Armatimonadia bacterium]
MDPLILVIVGLVFAMVLVIALAWLADERRLRVQERVDQLHQRPRSPLAEELALPFHERVVKPVMGRFINAIGAMAPAEALENARQELERAGNPMGLNAQSFMTMRVFTALAGIGGAFWLFSNPAIGDNLRLPLAGFVLVVGVLAPHYILQKSIQGRHNMIRKALPDVIDLLVVSVEAGAGLDGALAEVVQRKEGPLVEEFRRLLGEVRVGKTRRRAWQDMADRVGEDNLSALVGSLAQAEQLGVSIAKALRTQSDSLRTRRSLQIKEVAAALPVKMLFPLIFFIFPSLFVILLGPGMLSMTDLLGTLGGGE